MNRHILKKISTKQKTIIKNKNRFIIEQCASPEK